MPLKREHRTPAAGRSAATAMYILISRGVALLANVAVVLLVTRYLGPEGFGKYAFVMGYSLVIGTLATGGVYAILIRETARDLSQAGANLGAALQVQVVFSIFAGAVAVLVLPRFTSDAAVRTAGYISAAACIVQVLANLYAWLFTAFEDTRYTALSVFFERGIFLAGIVLVVVLRLPFLAIFWVQLISFSCKLVFCSLVVRLKFTRTDWRLDLVRFRFFFRESLPLLFSSGFRTLDAQLDTLLLQVLGTTVQLGLFGAPYRIISGVNLIPDSVMAGLLPALSNLAATARDRALELYGKIFKYFLVASVPIAFVVSLWSQPLMGLLFGADYAGGAATLRIMVWAVVLSFPNFLFAYLFTAINKQQYDTIRLAISIVAHAALSVWLIPRMGAAGAALAMLAAQAVAFVVGYGYITRALGAYQPWGVLLKLSLGALPALAIMRWWSGGPMVAQLVLAGAAYFVVLALLRTFERDEVALLWRALRPRALPIAALATEGSDER